MFRFAICFLLPSWAFADTFVTDAFGILPRAEISEARASWAGLQTGSVLNTIQPQSPDAVLLFIGAKSLVAGKEKGHAVALALDAHGNLVQEADAMFALETNDMQSTIINDGLADVIFFPAPITGTFTGGADVEGIQSARALYRVVADLESVQPTLGSSDPLKTENFTTLSSDELIDQFGNPVEDGVGTTLQLTHKDGATTLLSAPVRETRAEATLLVRDLKTGGQLSSVLGINSETASVDLEPLLSSGSIEVRLWKVEDLEAVAIRVGPVSTDAGHLLVDGSPVATTVVAGNETVSQNGWLLGGYFETVLPLSGSLISYEVTISTALGEQSSIVKLTEMPTKIRGAE